MQNKNSTNECVLKSESHLSVNASWVTLAWGRWGWMLSIARTASFAGSAALLLTTSPMDFPGNRRDKMEMTSSLVGSSKSPIIRSSLALWIFYKQPPLCVNWTISLTGIYIYLKKKWFKERNKKFQKNSMEHYKKLVPVNILLELLLSI